ncbi:cell wall hydrolase [Candidatus Saccharibacteria bacterium]|nr:cell wall hydrolase [Candidatus Saccharibacteria bacterium]
MRNLTRRFLILLATILVGLNYQVATVYAAEDAPVDVPIDELALKLQEQQVAEQETETEVTEVGVEGDDVLLAGLCEVEARGITDPDQIASVCWTVLNRVDSPLFPNTVRDVIYAPGQFAAGGIKAGVEKRRPDMLDIARDVLGRWSAEKSGVVEPDILSSGRTIPPDCVYFWGDGSRNHFNNGATEHVLDTENSPYK